MSKLNILVSIMFEKNLFVSRCLAWNIVQFKYILLLVGLRKDTFSLMFRVFEIACFIINKFFASLKSTKLRFYICSIVTARIGLSGEFIATPSFCWETWWSNLKCCSFASISFTSWRGIWVLISYFHIFFMSYFNGFF